MSDVWTIHITIDGPGASVSQSVEIPAASVWNTFDGLEEAAHELVASLVTDLREVDRFNDGEYVILPACAR